MSCPRLASAYGSNGQIFIAGDALREKVAGELVGPVEERVEILVGALGVAHSGRPQFMTAWPLSSRM